MTRVIGVTVLAVVAACGSKGGGDKVDPEAAEGFARALEAVAGAEPTRSAAMLAEGAFETIAPSMKCFEGFARAATERARVEALLDCGLACTPDAVQKLKGVEPRSWMAELAAACEPAHFGLEKSSAALLSPEWFLLHKIAELAGPHVTAADGAAKARLEQAMAGLELPLPLPAVARGMFELPVVPAEVSAPVATRTYVIVPGKGPLRIGAAPFARLGARGAAMEAPEGRALFPGNEVAQEDLRAMVLENAGAPAAQPADAGPPPPQPPPAAPSDAGAPPAPRGQYKMKGPGDSALAKRQAIDSARAAGILGVLGKDGRARGLGAMGPIPTVGLPPGLHGEVDKAVRGDLGRGGDPVPLLLADGARPAAEVIDLAAELPHVLIGVASADDPAARALLVDIASVMNTSRAPDQAYVALAPGGLEAARTAAGGSDETVVIRVEDGVPWTEAVAVASVAIARGARHIIFTSAKMDLGGGTGSGGALLGHGAYGSGKPALSLVTEGETDATGDLDKNVIRRVVRRQLVIGVRACYEKELLRSPKLAGRVDIEFTIGPDGAVGGAKGSGMKEVIGCAVDLAKLMKFPKPSGGGSVKVRYPLVFKPKDE